MSVGPIVGIRLPTERSQWPGVTRRTCHQIRNRLLKSCRLEKDGSGAPEVIAAKRAAEEALPCRVIVYEMAGDVWLRFVLSGPPFSFEFGDPADLEYPPPPVAMGSGTFDPLQPSGLTSRGR